MYKNLNMSWQQVIAAQKTNCNQRSVARRPEVILPLHCALMKPHLECCV